jgi:hypothetical protein
MRWILALAVVVVGSVAIGDEALRDAPKDSSYGDATRQGAVISELQPPPTQASGGPPGLVTFPAPSAIDTESKVCAIIDRNSFTLKFGPKPNLSQGSATSTYVICDKISADSSPSDSSTLTCTGCKVILPGGSHGTASEATYCSKTDKLTLHGSKDEPVQLTIHSAGSSQTLTASELVVDIKPVAQPTIVPVQGQVLPSRYEGPQPWQSEPNWNDAIGDPRGGPKEISR